MLASLGLAALLTGRLLAADARPIDGATVLVRWSRDTASLGDTDTLVVAPDGRFGGLLREARVDSVVVSVRFADTTQFYPVSVVLPRERLARDIHVLLVPRRWRITGGRFDGRVVPIEVPAALRRIPGFGAFGRVSAERVVGWQGGSFPLPVVIRRDGRRAMNAADSSLFWEAARDLEDAVGVSLFRPATDTSMIGRIFPVDIFLDDQISGAGLTFISWDKLGQIFEAAVRFHDSSDLRRRDVIQHELMHVLGFGHTAAWPSTLGPRRPLMQRTVSESDVAHAQLLMRVHDLENDDRLVAGLAAVVIGP